MERRLSLSHKQWAILIFGVAFLVRLIYLLQIKSNPYFYAPMVDEAWHLSWSKEILQTSFWGTEVYFRGPLYPYLLALLLKITSSEYFWTRLVQMLFSAGSVALTYLIGRDLFTERVARLASIFLAFYGTMIMYDGMFLLELLFVFLNLLGLFVLIRNRDNPSYKAHFVAGLIFGLSAITRPNVLLVVPFLALWLFIQFRGQLVVKGRLLLTSLFTLGIILPIVPVTVRNWMVIDDFVLISSQGGINLYLGNNPSAEGLTMMMPEIVLDARVPVTKFVPTVRTFAEKEVGHPLKPSEESAFWNNKAKNYIFSHPGAFIGLTFKKFVYFFSGFENSDQHDIYDFRNFSSLMKILLFDHGLKFPYGLCAPLALVGIALAWPRRKELAPLLIFFVAYIPTVILFLVTARHRLTVIPIMLLFAAFTVFYLWDSIRSKISPRTLIAVGAMITLVILSNTNFFDLGFRNIAQTHYNLALTHARQGKNAEAVAEYHLAIQQAPGVPSLYYGLGAVYSAMGKHQDAVRELERAVTLDPNFADALINLGMAYVETRDFPRAEQTFQRAIALDSKRPEPHINLGSLYMMQNKLDQSRQAFEKALELQPNDHISLSKVGLILGRAGDSSAAYIYFRKAIQINPSYAAGYLNWGNICLINGDTTEAVEKYQQALGSDSLLAEPYFNLALIYIRTGDKTRARQYVDRLLQIRPNFDRALELRRRLEQ